MNDTPSTHPLFRTSQLEEADAPPHNPSDNPTMGEIIGARFSRRGLVRGSLAVSAIAVTVGAEALRTATEAVAQTKGGGSAFSFKEVEAGVDANHHVAEGYDADVLLRWGDPVFADAPDFDPLAQAPDRQARQFGYNN
ncbi:MAG: alkaline phosphatase PhoX, partial [Beijerinckiaceae bacterium]